MPKKSAVRKSTPQPVDALFARLRKVLVPYAKHMVVKFDGPGIYYLETEPVKKFGSEVFFGEVQARGKALHLAEQVGVTREVDAPAARDLKADRLCFDSRERVAAPAMLCTRGLDAQTGDGLRLARGQLRHRGEPGATKELSTVRRTEHGDPRVEALQRATVRVVEVQMGEQNSVDPLGDLGWRIAALPAQRAHPAAQHGIGEQALAVQLEEHGGVTHVCDPVAHRTPRPCRLVP